MLIPAQYLPAAYSLTAMGMWGISDFAGGVGARRTNAFLFTAIVHTAGIFLMGSLSFFAHAPFPRFPSVFWAVLAGSIGGISLALFYRALASGNMGLIAPVAAVLGAAIPTAVTAVTEGAPTTRQLLGFGFAVVGVWLISRTEGEFRRPEGLGLAIVAGCGFAGFYVCVHQAGNGSALWIATISRCASLTVTLAMVLLGKNTRTVPAVFLLIAIVDGCLDVGGSALFVRAQQLGRLDVAVVLSSLYPAITVLLARIFLNERFSRSRTVGVLAALAAVPMIAG